MDFQISLLLLELQVIRDWLCVIDITETSLNRLLLLLILKSSHRTCYVGKGTVKSFTGKHFCWSLFLIKLQVKSEGVSERRCFPLKFAKFLKTLIFKKTCFFMYLLLTIHEKDTTNETQLEPSETYMVEFFWENSQQLLAINYFHKNVSSQIFGRVLNMPLSYYDSIFYYNTDDNTALPSSEFQINY